FSMDEDLTGLGTGVYEVTVTDDNGCTVTMSYTITEPSAVVCMIQNNNIQTICTDNIDIDLSAVVSGGTTPYQSYTWSSNNATIVTPTGDGSTATVSNFQPGITTITLVVTDANGCTSTCTTTIEAEDCTNACTWTPGFWKNHDAEICAVLGGSISGKGKKKTCIGATETLSITVCGLNDGNPINLTADQVSKLFAFSSSTRGNKNPCANPSDIVEEIACYFAPYPNGETLIHHILAAKLNLLANAKYLGITNLGDILISELICRTPSDDIDLGKFYLDYPDATPNTILNMTWCFDDKFTGALLSTYIKPLTYFNECHDDCGLPSNIVILPDAYDVTDDFIIETVVDERSDNGYKVKAFPNPTREYVDLDLRDLGEGETTIELRDALGRFVKQYKIQTVESLTTRLDLPQTIQDGMYYLRIRNQEQLEVIPIIVSNR
ncbi:MAG: T9SS type A sorting domain-containing protein, partial [Saprospiraceae bacterium]|nr:T9SS type A sorting domain-containing protein [Saprospiraceae bacterium]